MTTLFKFTVGMMLLLFSHIIMLAGADGEWRQSARYPILVALFLDACVLLAILL